MFDNPWIIGGIVCLVAFWIVQFAQMMTLREIHFPAWYDKILWFIAFLLVSALAPETRTNAIGRDSTRITRDFHSPGVFGDVGLRHERDFRRIPPPCHRRRQ